MKINDIVAEKFSFLEDNLRQEIFNYGILKKAEPDKIILEIRREIEFIPFVVSGVIKVMRRDGKGNGIFLHYITSSQTSAIGVTFALENKNCEIRLKAESTVSYIAVPAKTVNSWFLKYNSWRSYYQKLNSEQTSFLIEKINDIAFESLEYRLLKYLEQASIVYNDTAILRKHFDVARDLKVSREAISRVLKKLEKEGIITLGRNKIILN